MFDKANFTLGGIKGEPENERASSDIPGLEDEGEVEVPPRADEVVGGWFPGNLTEVGIVHEVAIYDYGAGSIGRR